MSRTRLEFKVGLFVLLGLALIAGLLLRFSKEGTLLRKTYTIILNVGNVGGLQHNASVQLSGVVVGTATKIELAPSGTNVEITLKIYSDYIIREGARFAIEQSGILGDKYVAVYPAEPNNGNPLTNGASASAENPFNIQEFTRSAAGFINRIDGTAKKLDDTIVDVRRDLLNQQTLTNLAYTIDSLHNVSDNAARVMDSFNSLVNSNGASVGEVLSNLNTFSERLNGVAVSLQQTVDTNQPQITLAISNLVTSTEMLTNFMHQAETGKGVAGALLTDEKLAKDISDLASNLSVAAGNLRSNGLWSFLWKPKPPPPPHK